MEPSKYFNLFLHRGGWGPKMPGKGFFRLTGLGSRSWTPVTSGSAFEPKLFQDAFIIPVRSPIIQALSSFVHREATPAVSDAM